MKIGLEFEISYAHRLLKYQGLCSNLHGHNGKVQIEVVGQVERSSGMVLDFGILKDWTKRHFDHSTILQEGDPLLEHVGGRLVVTSHPPTAEVLAQIIMKQLKDIYPISQLGSEPSIVRFYETPGCYAECISKGDMLIAGLHWDSR